MEIALPAIVIILMVAFPVAAPPTTLQGPFPPRTIQFDVSLRRGSQDLEPKHSRVVRAGKGNEPEQISLALSTPDAMWVTWTTGKAQLAKTVTPLNASSVGRAGREVKRLVFVPVTEDRHCNLFYVLRSIPPLLLIDQ